MVLWTNRKYFNYRCNCKFGFNWSIGSKACIRQANTKCNIIQLKEYCNTQNTNSCEYNTSSIYPICICKDGFHGEDCSLVNNRCVLPSIVGNLPSGYESCGVLLGGQCISTSPTGKYTD